MAERDDDVWSTGEFVDQVIEAPGEEVRGIGWLAVETHVLADRVPLASLGELSVVGDQYGVFVVGVDGKVVVSRICTAGFGRGPAFVTGIAEHLGAARVNVVVEEESH